MQLKNEANQLFNSRKCVLVAAAVQRILGPHAGETATMRLEVATATPASGAPVTRFFRSHRFGAVSR